MILAAAPLVQQVPLAVTAGILIVAATSALQPRAARDVWRADKMSAAIMIVTFALVLAVPLQYAVLAGAAISVRQVHLPVVPRRARQAGRADDGGLPRETEPPPRALERSRHRAGHLRQPLLRRRAQDPRVPARRRRGALPRRRAAPARPGHAAQRHHRHAARLRGRVRGQRGAAVPGRRGCGDAGAACSAPACSSCWGRTRWWRRPTSSTAPAPPPSSVGETWLEANADGRSPGPTPV